MRLNLKSLFLLTACFFCSAAMAQSSPMNMLQNTSDQMLSALKANRTTLKSDPNTVYHIVNEILVPHVDVEVMSRLVLGRNAWMQATPEQRDRFTREFTRLVIHTYSSALASYTDETVRFMPIRGGYEGRARLQVQSMIVRHDGPPVRVNYRLESTGNDWLVYDFTVEGVSMVESFRSQFSEELANESLDMVIRKMAQHNSEGSA